MQVEKHHIHIREHSSFLAGIEKRTLVWMAQRLPRWITPDHLTILGLSAMILAGTGYWGASHNRASLLIVIVALGLNWLGDSLDGTVARVRNQQRPRYGWYVDHVVDIMGTSCLLGGLALSGYMEPVLALGLLVAFLLVEAEVFLATHSHGVFRMAFLGFGPTELRIILAVGTLYIFFRPWVYLGSLGPYRLFDVGGIVAIVALVLTLIISAVRNTRTLYRVERVTR